jgi:hypothetical protein
MHSGQTALANGMSAVGSIVDVYVFIKAHTALELFLRFEVGHSSGF